MTFVDTLMTWLGQGFSFIGDMIYKLIQFIAKPLTYVYYFFEGVFYFLYVLFQIAAKIIMIFVALVQFFIAIVSGFMRTLLRMLTINYDDSAIHYPDSSYTGIQTVLDFVRPMGFLDVVPLIVLAMIWFYFIKKMIGLLGGVQGDA